MKRCSSVYVEDRKIKSPLREGETKRNNAALEDQ
jgi:hypothetical protein